MQQLIPGIIIEFMQSQHAWIIFSDPLSPDMQLIMHPISIISILHIPITPRLQQQHIIPFIIMQQLIIPPCVIMHRFFIISAEVLSSQTHITFIPPAHFSIFIVHRGAIIMPGIIPLPIPGIAPPAIGIFIMPFIPGIIIPAIRSDVMPFIVFIMILSFPFNKPQTRIAP